MNKSRKIDAAMVFRKFYCHKCGEKLVKHPRTRIVRPGDPDYGEHSHIGRTQLIGPVEVTEYDFMCCNCDRIIPTEEQYVVERIQKKLYKNMLTDDEIERNIDEAKHDLEQRRKTTGGIFFVAMIALVVAVFVLVSTLSGK